MSAILSPSAAVLGFTPPKPTLPYRGIDSFRVMDQPIFFARRSEAEHLLRLVSVYRGVLVYGDSGVGKSSLINAGFIPRALEYGFLPERLRVQPHPGEEIIIERISVGPDDRGPFLPSGLVDPSERAGRPTLSVAAFLERVAAYRRNVRPVFIFDQFEELYTLFEEAPRSSAAVAAARAAQEQILDALAAVLNNHSLPVKLVFSFREDYLAKLARLFERSPGLIDQFLRLTAPGTDDIDSIVRGPLRTVPERFGGRFSDELLDHLVADLQARFEPRPVQLAEVQIACWQLWGAVDPDAHYAARRLSGLLEDFFSGQIAQLPPTRQDTAVALLARMITRSGARNISSTQNLVDLVHEETDLPAEQVEAVLRMLDNETKLVRREFRQDVEYYTIVSEFLVDWIRKRNELRLRTVELQKAEAAERTHRARQRTRYIIGLGTLSMVVLGTLVALLLIQTREKDQALFQLNAVRDSIERVANQRQEIIKTKTAETQALSDSANRLYMANAETTMMAGMLSMRAEELERLQADSAQQLAAERRARQELAQALEREVATRRTVEAALRSANATLSSTAEELSQERGIRESRERRIATLQDSINIFRTQLRRGERQIPQQRPPPEQSQDTSRRPLF
jgi:hypothetical protein